jgi:hypothetical protein
LLELQNQPFHVADATLQFSRRHSDPTGAEAGDLDWTDCVLEPPSFLYIEPSRD